LKAAVTLKLQYVNSEESAVPRTMYAHSDVESRSHAMEMLDSAVYIQGSEELIEKMYTLYHKMQGIETPIQQHESVLSIGNRKVKQPEAHVTLKMLGLQRFYSIDSQMIQGIIRQLTKEFYNDGQFRGITKNFLKVLDIHGYNNVIPTELGLPLYVMHRTPVVISTHASLVMVKNGEVEIKVKPVFNYKQQTTVGLHCPFTKDNLGAGVETSVHVTLPLRADVAVQHGQLSVTLKTPVDHESQKVKPVVELRVVPYTALVKEDGTLVNLGSGMKIIPSQHAEKKLMELQLGEKLGMDLKFKMESEHKFTDLANLIHTLSHHNPLTLLALPLPPMTVASHSMSLIYNPTTSLTKHTSFVMSFGHGKKVNSNSKATMVYPQYQVDQEIETQCNAEQECMKEMFCNKEKEHCMKELRKQNRPTSEINKYCSTKSSQCNQRHVLRQNIRKVLNNLGFGSALTFNIVASLHGNHEETIKEVETHFTIGQATKQQKSKTKISASIKTVPGAEPMDLEIYMSSFMNKPLFAWDIQSILQQQLEAGINIDANFGFRESKKTTIVAKVKAMQSEDQKMFAEHSEISKKCITEMESGLVSSVACKQARQHAASLDVVEADVKIPNVIRQSHLWVSLEEMMKLYYLPYLSISKVQSEYVDQEFDQYVLRAKIGQLGEKMTFNVENRGENMEIKDLRIPRMMQGLVPISTKDDLILNIIQKVTVHGAPSVCSVQGDKVTTFDKFVYDYQLNDCEHVVFKDCSPSNLVEVSVKKAGQVHYIKVVLANNKYELELPKQIRSSRSTPAVIKVNGEQKVMKMQSWDYLEHEFVELEKNYYGDANTYLTSYKDGVYAIVSKLYGIAVFADGESLEVRTFQHSLRNKACGLCGDLNDEKTADMKSASMCIMSSPQLAAYSYMVPDNTCKGVPTEHLNQFKAETDKCAKKVLVPTKVTEVLQQKTVIAQKHLVEESINQVCMSKKQIPVCAPSTVPKEVVLEEVPFFCVPKDTAGATLMRIAEHGEKIQSVEEYPTIFVKKVSHPIRC